MSLSSDYSYSCKTVLYGTVGYHVSEYTLVVSVSRVEDLLHVPVAELRYSECYRYMVDGTGARVIYATGAHQKRHLPTTTDTNTVLVLVAKLPYMKKKRVS